MIQKERKKSKQASSVWLYTATAIHTHTLVPQINYSPNHLNHVPFLVFLLSHHNSLSHPFSNSLSLECYPSFQIQLPGDLWIFTLRIKNPPFCNKLAFSCLTSTCLFTLLDCEFFGDRHYVLFCDSPHCLASPMSRIYYIFMELNCFIDQQPEKLNEGQEA